MEELAQRTVARFGKIDLWFNNAGISGPYGPVAAMPAEAWRAVIDTNVNGTFYGTQVALRQMLPRNRGKIVNLIGAGARESKREQPFLSPYLASKAAVLRFTQTAAAEYKHTPLSILAWSPGLVRTELVMGAEPLTPDAAAKLQQLEPVLDRIGTPLAKVGEEALRLAGPDTDGVSGKVYETKPSVWQLLRLILKR